MSSTIRVFIVDDHPLVREWLGNLLRMEKDFVVSGEAEDPVAAAAAMVEDPPDVAVVDLSLQRGSGLDLIKDLRARLPEVPVIVLSMHEEIADIERAFRAGARGYVMKRESTGQIVQAIKQVRSGLVFANPMVLAQLASRFVGRPMGAPATPREVLSDRELEVFRRLGRGHATRQIAEDLGVSMKTVQTYFARIKEKLGVDDATELARVAYRAHEEENT
jgi:DNA-binding NarL/FixJ family response regulator